MGDGGAVLRGKSGTGRARRRALGCAALVALVGCVPLGAAADPGEAPEEPEASTEPSASGEPATPLEPAGPPRHDRSTVVTGNVAGESTFLSEPPFPGMEITDAFRIQLETFAVPDASLGQGHVTLVRPEVGGSATWPVSERLVLRLSGALANSRYRFRGDPWSPAVESGLGDALDLYAGRLALEGAWLLEGAGPWIADGEIWSVIGTLYGGSRWEDGAFGPGLGAGGALGVGYEIPGRLRLALGVSLRTSIEEGGLDPGPLVSLRWDVTDRLTLRNRQLGLQLDVDVTPAFELYVAGFRASDRFRLKDRGGSLAGLGFEGPVPGTGRDASQVPLGDLTFRDRQVRVGAGVDWVLANWLHLELEVGGIAHRRLRLTDEDLGTLASRSVDPSVYFDVRLEVRL